MFKKKFYRSMVKEDSVTVLDFSLIIIGHNPSHTLLCEKYVVTTITSDPSV